MLVSMKIDLKYIAMNNNVELSVPRCREGAINALKLCVRYITGVTAVGDVGSDYTDYEKRHHFNRSN